MQPKSQLALITEQITPKKRSVIHRLDDYPEYKYLIPLGMEEALNEVLDIVFNRYMMLRRSLSIVKKTLLDEIFTASLQLDPYPHPHAKTKLNDKLKLIFGKEQIAAFHHIRNASSSISHAISEYQKFGADAGIKLLCAGLYELYLGDQRFFNEDVKTRSEVAKAGGIARQHRHLPTKQKACELLNTLTPIDGWRQELDACKAILPEIEKYMEENNIRNPTKGNIKVTLREWIKSDPIVSAAVRIAQPPTHNSPG